MKLLLPLLLFITAACLQEATDTSHDASAVTARHTLLLAESKVKVGKNKLETNISQIKAKQDKREFVGDINIQAGRDLSHTNTRLEFSSVEFNFIHKNKQHTCKLERVPMIREIKLNLNSNCKSNDEDKALPKIDVCLDENFKKIPHYANTFDNHVIYEGYRYKNNTSMKVYVGLYTEDHRKILMGAPSTSCSCSDDGDYGRAMVFMREKEIYCEESKGKLFLVFPLKKEKGHADYQRIELTKMTWIGLHQKDGEPALGVNFKNKDGVSYDFYDTDTEGIIKTHKLVSGYTTDDSYKETIILENYQKK